MLNGAHIVKGKIKAAWVSDGRVRGHFGYPISDEEHPDNGAPANHRRQLFKNGFLYWTGETVYGEWGDSCPTCRLTMKFDR